MGLFSEPEAYATIASLYRRLRFRLGSTSFLLFSEPEA